MRYPNVKEGRFLSRPNRFLAKVVVEGREEAVHVKNTGRCGELLLPDVTVYLTASDRPNRKTKYDLIAVEKETDDSPMMVNIDSQAPNAAVGEWLPYSGLFADPAVIRREVTWGRSRFDFCVEEHGQTSFLEVKGVTLEQNGIALFPDAPTERGIKHLKELMACQKEGHGAYVLFLIQMKGVHIFSPNRITHPAFAETLKEAKNAGVTVLAYDCKVEKDSMAVDKAVKINI